ncbi:tRNA-uridine aminocarboxypropyltransferase 1 [Octopus sinensis]|uniref:tRNA-uridine aminocarboxypropyltransferase 1 n=1 Tax=Octopus sinensis TaxID=2607531 RepID=A0A6P7TMA4_9MOLL|nr:tRNA-uridine aminocarboxypropyltransferase 1 [Octopus sinensis]XP_036368357.1 tRNA-uridine aminocarboxypropyltransferase 1 [Octopus sinensis]
MEENPFPDLKISNYDFLDESDDRRVCPKCGKSRKYFCYTCYKPVIGTEHLTPVVKLPIAIDILRHPSECAGKSTASHAAVLAPDNVSVYTYPCVPNYDKDKVVLVFPGPQSVTLEELKAAAAAGCISNPQTSSDSQHEIGDKPYTHVNNEDSTNGLNDSTKATKRKSDSAGSPTPCRKYTKLSKAPFERVIFIDCTWNQTNRISKDDRLKGIRCVEMKTRHTKFWRHQRDKPNTYLSTVEAIYYFLRDYHTYFISDEYHGEYDNLLFFFCFMYQKIRCMYDGGHHLLAYKQKDKKESEETQS